MVDGREETNGSDLAEKNILDAYAQGDTGDRLALFLGYRDMRRAFRAVDLTKPAGAKAGPTGKRRIRCCPLGHLLSF